MEWEKIDRVNQHPDGAAESRVRNPEARQKLTTAYRQGGGLSRIWGKSRQGLRVHTERSLKGEG